MDYINGKFGKLLNASDLQRQINELKETTEELTNTKQDNLVAGENIRTIDNISLLGPGDIPFKTFNHEKIIGEGNINFKTLNGASLTGEGNIELKTLNGEDLLGPGEIITKDLVFRTILSDDSSDDDDIIYNGTEKVLIKVVTGDGDQDIDGQKAFNDTTIFRNGVRAAGGLEVYTDGSIKLGSMRDDDQSAVTKDYVDNYSEVITIENEEAVRVENDTITVVTRDTNQNIFGEKTFENDVIVKEHLTDGTHSTTIENLVTKTDDQVISGKKTFAGQATFDTPVLVKDSLTDGSDLEIAVSEISTATNLENGTGNAALAQKNVELAGITWNTSDDEVVTVDSYGNVTAVGPGDATITAYKVEGQTTYSAECAISVTRPAFLFSSIVPTEVILYTLDGSISEGSSTYDTESTITQAGLTWKVTGNTIQSPWRIGGKGMSETPRPLYSTSYIPGTVAKVSIEHGNMSSSKPTVHSIQLIVASDANFEDILYTETVGPISANSTINFICPEETEVEDQWTNAYYKLIYSITNTAASSNKYIELESIKFYEGGEPIIPVTDVELNTHQLVLVEGEEVQLSAEVSPEDASNREVRWTSTDSATALVSASGLVSGIYPGTATITATSVSNPEISDACEVVVTGQSLDSLKLNTENLSLRVGDTYKLKAYYKAQNFARGDSSVALGRGNTLRHGLTFAYGDCLTSTRDHQVLLGTYNNLSSESVFVIGNGTDSSHRNNAFEVTESGKVITGASTSQNDSDKVLTTKDYVDNVVSDEIAARQEADNDLQSQIDAIESKADVVDVVPCYDYNETLITPKPDTDLIHYNTDHPGVLTDQDVVKVLDDEIHGDATTYYRWVITDGVGAWTFIGAIGPYVTLHGDQTIDGRKTFTNSSTFFRGTVAITEKDSGAPGCLYIAPQDATNNSLPILYSSCSGPGHAKISLENAGYPLPAGSGGVTYNFHLSANTEVGTAVDVKLPHKDGILAIDSELVHKTGNLAETISGQKTFDSDVYLLDGIKLSSAGTSYIKQESGVLKLSSQYIYFDTMGMKLGSIKTTLTDAHSLLVPSTSDWQEDKTIATTHDLTGFVTGPSSATANHVATFSDGNGKTIKDSGAIIDANSLILKDFSNNNVYLNAIIDSFTTINKTFAPGKADGTSGTSDNIYDLGTSWGRWKNLYLSGNLSDGTNSVTVANIAKDDNVIHKGTSASPVSAETRYGDLTIYGTSSTVSPSLVVDSNGVTIGTSSSRKPITAQKFIAGSESNLSNHVVQYEEDKIVYKVNNSGTYTSYNLSFPEKTGTIAVIDSNNSITIGNTTLTETQLQKLLALLDTLEAKDIE